MLMNVISNVATKPVESLLWAYCEGQLHALDIMWEALFRKI